MIEIDKHKISKHEACKLQVTCFDSYSTKRDQITQENCTVRIIKEDQELGKIGLIV
jgi:hypothetical protein